MFCRRPFEQFYVTSDGNVHLCCPEWIDRPAGNLLLETPASIWEGPVAQELRSGILDGSFRHCGKCPHLPGPSGCVTAEPPPATPPSMDRIRVLTVAYDPTCNLTCPSCRKGHKTAGPGAAFIQKTIIESGILERVDMICSSGSGDPLASALFLDLLRQLPTLAPKVNVSLQTNGLLLTPQKWDLLDSWGVGSRIVEILVSMDAATPGTYQENRGGNFQTLVENITHARERVPYLQMNMVVQENNFREMQTFVELADQLRADVVFFSALQLWNDTYSMSEYLRRAVHLPSHPHHGELVKTLANPLFDRPSITLSLLSRLRKQS
jgi:MoaA/NifB/PqqE/SkfB family radical SAM enzyme